MRFNTQDGQFIFTLSSLNRSQTFISFMEGIHWAFAQKLAGACAIELRLT